MKKFYLFLAAALLGSAVTAQTTLVAFGTSWKYLANGSNQGTAWRGTGFSDASWTTGNAQLGYGDGDEATVVSYGPDANNKYATTYFRKVVSIADVNAYANYTFNCRRDDGMVVYVNGTEVWRNNMPTGTIAYNTWASTACSDDGGTVQTVALSKAASMLVSGNNTIAVEMHQSGGTSSDLSFDFQLQGLTGGGAGATISRGPYLQKLTQSTIVLRWRTNTAVDSKVNYGTSSSNLNLTATVSGTRTEHTVTLSGLSAFTKYYYSIGTATGVIQQGTDNNFTTMPANGAGGKYSFWVTGDCGNNSTNQANCLSRYQSYMGSNVTNGWLLLGDNAYNSGTDAEYTSNFFNVYQGSIMKNAPLFPAPGNHDYGNSATNQDNHANSPYYSIFDLPTNGECGGLASGKEEFYSYDYGNIHFLSLDSYGEESNKRLYDTTGAQALWIKQDLAANTKPWVVAYFHHAPYTMTSHNSDTESDLATMRTKFVKMMENLGVDLILAGHSHGYERSKLIKGHYGMESTFTPATHNMSSSSALYDGTSNSCPYFKDASHTQGGTVYVVAGSSGQLGGTQAAFPHNAMHYSNATNGGSMVLEFDNNRLDAKWICADGVVRDKFTIVKGSNVINSYNIISGQNQTLTASWNGGSYVWSNGATTKSITVSPTSTTTYTVRDQYSCIQDSYTVNVAPAIGTGVSEVSGNLQDLNIFPNPFKRELTISYTATAAEKVQLEILDLQGATVGTSFELSDGSGQQKIVLDAASLKLSSGVYMIKLTTGSHTSYHKVSYMAE